MLSVLIVARLLADHMLRRGLSEETVMANQAAVGEYQEMLRHGTMSVGIYTPREVDNQKPHSQDEVYIIASGTGVFCAGQRADRVRSVETRSSLAPGARHRFVEFSDDLDSLGFVLWPTRRRARPQRRLGDYRWPANHPQGLDS